MTVNRLNLSFLASVLALCFLDPTDMQAQLQRVNLAKIQSVASDSATATAPALFATDGFVGNTNCWMSSGGGPHWLAITLPLAMQLGSAQMYLGSDDTAPVTNFSLQYYNGTAWINIPGASFSGNTNTVLDVVFSSPVMTSQVRFYSTDAAVTVREIALFAINGPAGYPLGTDVTLNLCKKCSVIASSVAGTNYAIYAVDGYAGTNVGWQSANVNGPHTLEVDFPVASRIGSAQLYSGSSTQNPVADFTLQYWNGSAWAAIPGGTVTGNTQMQLNIAFSAPVSTTKVLLSIPDNGTQFVRELAVFAAAAGVNGYPLWTDVVSNDPPTTQWETYGDGFWNIINGANSNALIVSASGASQAPASATDLTQQFQILYNLDSDTFRLRNRATWQCIAAQNAGNTPGTAVVECPAYSAMPHELWRFQNLGGGYYRIVNVWNGLALQTDGQTPATVTLAVPSMNASQQWQFNFQTIYPKKGVADYGDEWSRFGASWNYNWSPNSTISLPPQVVFSPMQWSGAGINNLPQYYPAWHANPEAVTLLAFNEPDLAGQADMTVSNAIALWPQLQATDMPLVSPALSWALQAWNTNFYSLVASNGFRVDYTGVHWYAYPTANDFINHLQSVYNTWGLPLWVTEFSVSSSGGTWTEEMNYTFLAEILWRMEKLSFVHRYSIFCYSQNPPANPWDQTDPLSAIYKSDGVTFTTLGELYAAWDADLTIHSNMPYILHNEGSCFRISNSGSASPSTSDIYVSDATVQWELLPASTTNYWYLASLIDGRYLSWDGTNLNFASSGTIGSTVEWAYTAYTNGYFLIDSHATSQCLGINRVNNSTGAPVSVTLTMYAPGTIKTFTCWRFIKPYLPVPTGLMAVAGYATVGLNWTAVAGATNYNVMRSTVSGGPYTTIAAGVTATNYTDTGLVNGTIYYYVVSAQNIDGEGPNSTEASAEPGDLAVNSGGGAVGWFLADAYFSGGTTSSTTATIDTSTTTNPAPQAVYQANRYGNITYTFSNLTAGVTYQVRLHFAETYWTAAGKRTFNVSINGVTVLANFDIFATAGAQYRATVQQFNGVADGTGRITVQFATVKDNAQVNGIEILRAAPSTPAELNATSSTAQIMLTWTASPNATGYNLYRSTTNGGSYALIASGVATASYTDAAVANGTTYYYVVTAVNANGESADSNQATALVPLPSLAVTYSGNNLVLSWPMPVTGFTLYSTPGLTPPIVWSPVTNTVTSQNGILSVTVPMGGENEFFQLMAP